MGPSPAAGHRHATGAPGSGSVFLDGAGGHVPDGAVRLAAP
ncbi:hypothetical protein BN2537_12235 [Streptomyces venezuelae]|nr:hypothetical protein BN2537_12235 [Streptomyces venezuelae]